MNQQLVVANGRRMRMTLTVIRVDVASFRWGRRVMGGRLVPTLRFASRGIVAGTTSATYIVKSYMFEVISEH